MGTVVLWVHAICGALWIGASACFAIACLALNAGSTEQRDFLQNGAPRINRLAIAAAVVLPLTGVFNWSYAIATHRGTLSPVFTCILAAKIALYLLMLFALTVAIRALPQSLNDSRRGDAVASARAVSTMLKAHAAIVAMGAIAMILGVWLTGA